jgi:hypothetical protein
MKGDVIPDPDHVARHCKTSTVEGNEIMAAAFMPREGEESLSVNRLEELKCPDRVGEVRALQDLYTRKMNRVGAGARIAILNVGTVRARIEQESPAKLIVRVLHNPEDDDPSHSGIYGISYDDREIVAELIAQVVLEKHPARA